MKQRWPNTLTFALVMIAHAPAGFAQMTPAEQLATLRVPEGFQISLFAAEPMITNPSAIDVDTHGRVWVAEIQWYRANAKQPPADRIKVLEDTDGDGMADKVTVFADGVFAPMSVCVAGDKVFVATSPDLWVYEDKDGDLQADGPPKKLLTGFGGFNHDHGAHSLVLGPDHKWWMSHGDAGFDVKGRDGSRIRFKWGAMLRGELDGSQLEIVAANFRNPYELCVSSFGECFMSDNDNDGNESVRAGWVLEGGDYGWYGSPPGPKGHVPPELPFSQHWHFRGHIPGHVPAPLVTGFGSPCGICFYEGDAFGAKYKNAPLHCDAGPREVRIYRHELAGYGMKAMSENIVTSSGDNYFRPDDICAAPDGSLFVADWYDGGVGGHAYNDPDRGRIFRVTPKGQELQRIGKPGPYSNIVDAIEGLKSPNLATQFLARDRLLSEGNKSIAALKVLLNDRDSNIAARALWVLDRLGGDGRQVVVDHLKSKDASFRALAVRILRRHGEMFSPQLVAMAGDSSAEVCREVLLAIAKLDGDGAFESLVDLAANYDGNDRYQLETIKIAAGKRSQALYARLHQAGRWSSAKLPLMMVLDPKAAGTFLTDRLAEALTNEAEGKALLEAAALAQSTEAGRGVLNLLTNANAPAELRRFALQKLDVGLASGWKPLARDPRLAEAMRPLLADMQFQSRVLELASKHAIAALGPDILRLAVSADEPAAVRQRALAAVTQLKPEGYSDALSTLLAEEHPAVRQAALNALVDMQEMKTVKAVLAGAAGSPAIQEQAVDRLMSRPGGALVLLRMLDSKALSATLEKQVVARAANHADSNVRMLFEKHIPPEQRPKKLGEAFQPEEILALPGDAKRGEQIFFESSAAQCKNCHAVHGQGATVGPDLSQIGKKYEQATLLETILQPSKAIAPEYYTYLVETERGQVFAGFVAEKTDQHLVLKDSNGELVRIRAKEIVELSKSEKSVMPELVLRDVPAQDAADLLAFLTSLTESGQSATRFRVLGPFDNRDRLVDAATAVEENLAHPDLTAEFTGLGERKLRWDVVVADSSAGFPAVDSVAYDRSHGLRSSGVTHYFLAFADSAADQEVTLLIGSDDACKVWVNGSLVHRNAATRSLGYAQDRVRTALHSGRNTILIKVLNDDGPGGVSLGVTSANLVQLKTD